MVQHSGSLLESIQQGEQDHGQERVGQRRSQFARPTPLQRESYQSTGNGEVHDLVHDVEKQRNQKPRAGIFHVELDSE